MAIKPPSYLDKLGKAKYSELAAIYKQPAQLALIETIAQGYSMYVRSAELINTEGLREPTERGGTKPHSAITPLKQGHEMVLKGCAILLKDVKEEKEDQSKVVKELLEKFRS